MKIKDLYYTLLKDDEDSRIIEAIETIMKENDAHNLSNFNIEYWLWQYRNLPTKHSFISIVKDNEDKILAYYHVPCYLGKLNNKEIKYAMIQDVAVSDKLRGQGIFREIATYANNIINQNNIKIVYTFPNKKSIHTFLKYNDFKLVAEMDSFIMPFNTSSLINSKLCLSIFGRIIGSIFDFFYRIFSVKADSKAKITQEIEITEDIMSIYSSFQQSFDYGLIKNKDYLEWRFLRKPNQKHYIFTIYDNNNRPKALVVLKEDNIKGIPCILIMDYAHVQEGEKYLLQLISNLRNNNKRYFTIPSGLLFTSMNSKLTRELKKIGLFSLPKKINPRQLNLLVRSNENLENIYESRAWHITLSDWDVF
jgi:hypothetical protein